MLIWNPSQDLTNSGARTTFVIFIVTNGDIRNTALCLSQNVRNKIANFLRHCCA